MANTRQRVMAKRKPQVCHALATNVCEHGDHPAPEGRRFCSEECARCEHESENEDTGCDGICLEARALKPAKRTKR